MGRVPRSRPGYFSRTGTSQGAPHTWHGLWRKDGEGLGHATKYINSVPLSTGMVETSHTSNQNGTKHLESHTGFSTLSQPVPAVPGYLSHPRWNFQYR